MTSLTRQVRESLTNILRQPWVRIVFNVGGAALLWGSWAAFVHRQFPLLIQIKAALTQATISAVFTLLGAAVLEAIFARSRDPWRVPVSALGTFSFIFSTVITLHTLADTPNILQTVAPTMVLSIFYCFAYTISLKKLEITPDLQVPSVEGDVDASRS